MAFVIANEVPTRNAVRLDRRGDLVTFADRHARIVLPGDNQDWLGQILDAIHGRDALLVFAHGRIPLISILGAAEVAAVRLRVLEKGDQIGNTDDVDRTANLAAV